MTTELEQALKAIQKLSDTHMKKSMRKSEEFNGDMATILNIANKALQPEPGWNKAQFGCTVTDKPSGFTGKFIASNVTDVWVLFNNWPEKWLKENCTFDPDPYTYPVKHDVPKDGLLPDWFDRLTDQVIGVDEHGGIHDTCDFDNPEIIKYIVLKGDSDNG